jgi:serine phosphatase RsbU (regulator of sigma subunit)
MKAPNGEGEEFSEQGLLAAARQHSQLSLPESLSAIADQARKSSPDEHADDLTLIVAKCT